jgi:hypothetical protein
VKKLAFGLLLWSFLVAFVPARAQPTYGDPAAPVAGKVLGMVVHTQDAEELRYVILKRLTDRYADEKGIVVTRAEKDAYVKQVQDTLERDRVRHAERRDELTRLLANASLSRPDRKALESQLASENDFLAALAEPTGDPAEIASARDEVAAAFIRQWKINRALYQQYGGRIIFQQGGPEPLDAYRKFLEQQRAQGDFVIVNKELERAFWRYYLNEPMHTFYPAGSKDEAQAFETPPWSAN